MDADLLNEAWKIGGVLGLLTLSGWAVAAVLWKQMLKERKEHREDTRSYFEGLVESTAAQVEVRVLMQRLLDK